MDSHTVRTRRGTHTMIAFLALVLVIAATVLTFQARSIWSTTTAPSVLPGVSGAVVDAPLQAGSHAQGDPRHDAFEAIKSRKGQ